jgi:1,4-dihydroxy-2-naphthoate octaprenyltransferase
MNANAPIAIYLILTMVSYYAIVVYAPYIGIPWLLIVVYMAIRDYRRYRKRKHNARYMDGKKVV